MLSKSRAWYKGLGRVGKASLWASSVVGLGLISTAGASNSQPVQQPASSPPGIVEKQEQTTTKSITETEVVPFASTTVNDPALESGKTGIKTAGVNGEKSIIYEITYVNGSQTKKDKKSEVISAAPVNEVKTIGTYVAPPPTPSAPNGASARCRDGSYSYSQSRSGTCSHHGGVSVWL